MQVVSGRVGREKVHYQAPAAADIPNEMRRFIDWFNSDIGLNPVLQAGIAHFWFITIHPFADGNGRIARALADMMLARADGFPQRFYSMSAQIRRERAAYYRILEKAQKGSLDITTWLQWFLAYLKNSLMGSQATLEKVLKKHRFWLKYGSAVNSPRQCKVLEKLLEGFTGKLTTAKWARIARCSSDPLCATFRNLLALVSSKKARAAVAAPATCSQMSKGMQFYFLLLLATVGLMTMP